MRENSHWPDARLPWWQIRRRFRPWKYLLRRERRSPGSQNLATRLRLLACGYQPRTVGQFPLDRYPLSLFLPEKHRARIWRIAAELNGSYGDHDTPLFLDKMVFEATIGRICPTVRHLGLIRNGCLHSFAPETDGAPADPLENWPDAPVVFCKPPAGADGKGVFRVDRSADGWKIDTRRVAPEGLRSRLADAGTVLLSEGVAQSAFHRELHPPTINTVRVLTMVDPSNGEPFVAAAGQRIGTSRSVPVDNFSRGGLCCDIDVETGCVSSACSPGEPGRRLDTHPDSGVRLCGRVVPHWPEIKNRLLQIVTRLSMLRYVGWDVVVGDDGFTLLEATGHPGLDLHQVHRPLLIDPRVERFYRACRVIR